VASGSEPECDSDQHGHRGRDPEDGPVEIDLGQPGKVAGARRAQQHERPPGEPESDQRARAREYDPFGEELPDETSPTRPERHSH